MTPKIENNFNSKNTHQDLYKKITVGDTISHLKKPIKPNHYDILIEHFIQEEEYEKCQIILKYKTERIDHERHWDNFQ